MRDQDTPSATARLVAAARCWARWLPAPLCDIAPDALGGKLAGGAFAWLDLLGRACPPLARLLLRLTPAGAAAAAITLRTRCLDDAVRAFSASGGRQVVLLGAGMDARAWRLAAELPAVAFFEVDSPGSQRAKRAALRRAGLSAGSARVAFVELDFEAHAAAALPAALSDALRAAGLDATSSLTVWEGVLVYLPREAADATLQALRLCGGPGSQLALTYQEPAREGRTRRGFAHALVRLLAARAGEQFRTFFAPDELRRWLAQHGMTLRWDVRYADIAAKVAPGALGPQQLARLRGDATDRYHFALADVAT